MNNNYDPNQQSQYQQAPQYQQPQYQQQYNQNQQYQDSNQQYYQQQYQDPNQQYYQQQYQDPNQQYYQQPYYQEPVDTSVFPLSIVGTCFSLSMVLSLIGLILTAVAKGKIKNIYARNPQPGGKIKAAKIISNIGFGFGLGFTIYFGIVFLMVIVGLIAEGL